MLSNTHNVRLNRYNIRKMLTIEFRILTWRSHICMCIVRQLLIYPSWIYEIDFSEGVQKQIPCALLLGLNPGSVQLDWESIQDQTCVGSVFLHGEVISEIGWGSYRTMLPQNERHKTHVYFLTITSPILCLFAPKLSIEQTEWGELQQPGMY